MRLTPRKRTFGVCRLVGMNIEMDTRVILIELNTSHAQNGKIIRSKFQEERDPEYVRHVKDEQRYLDITIKALKADSVHKLYGVKSVWAKWFIAWANAMQTIYSAQSLKDGSFHKHCESKRKERDMKLSRLERKE